MSPREEGEAGEEGEVGGEKREQDRRERVRRAHAIATELLDTEKHYVAILHLIDQVTHHAPHSTLSFSLDCPLPLCPMKTP